MLSLIRPIITYSRLPDPICCGNGCVNCVLLPNETKSHPMGDALNFLSNDTKSHPMGDYSNFLPQNLNSDDSSSSDDE
jgi:hypothetical protein